MSQGAIFLLVVAGMFPAAIIVAVVAKLWEVRKASRWPSTSGKVITSGVQSRRNQPGDHNYNFGDTEVSNEPRVEYEYRVGGRTYRGQRITIGEKTGGEELEAILARYLVGADVTVYYDPDTPQKAVLERTLPWGPLFPGVGCLLLFFIGAPLLAAIFYFNGVAWLKAHLAEPGRAPFVAVAGGVGFLVFLFGLSFMRLVRQAAHWPVTRGRITATGVEAYRDWRRGTRRRRSRVLYKPSVLYRYEVNGREYQGDRLTIGVTVSASWPGAAKRTAGRYPVGSEVDVHYNPSSPGESVLHPHSRWHLLLWVVAAGMLALAWAVGTRRLR